MKSLKAFTPYLFIMAVLVVIGCASTKVTERHSRLGTQKIPHPEHIYVYPFAATPADIPRWSSAATRYSSHSQPHGAEEIEAGRRIGILLARELVLEIRKMGLSALVGNDQTNPRVNDILIMGYFESIEEGSKKKRLALGFGSGAAKLKTAVEGYQMTSKGPRQLGSAKLDSGSSKTPGMAASLVVFAATANPLGLIVGGAAKAYGEASGKAKIEGAAKRTAEKIAVVLRKRFKEQGWIR